MVNVCPNALQFRLTWSIPVQNIRGYLQVGEDLKLLFPDDWSHEQSRIVFFLMNIHNRPRVIYFARVGNKV
jgi:hypothetical protein